MAVIDANLQRCLDFAREWRLNKAYGIILPENRNMPALSRRLDFDMRRDTGSGDNLLSLDLMWIAA